MQFVAQPLSAPGCLTSQHWRVLLKHPLCCAARCGAVSQVGQSRTISDLTRQQHQNTPKQPPQPPP